MPKITELRDPVPGNIGLLEDEDTVVLLPFTEPDELHPSDAAGTLEDFTRVAAGGPVAADDSVAWASEVTQKFPGNGGMFSTDKDDESSLLTRDVSIQMILAVNHTNGFGSANTWPVLRGSDPYNAAGATEYCAYGLKMQIDPTAAQLGGVRVAWTWQNLAGVTFLDAYEAFTAPHGQLFLLTCTRRWVSTTSVVLRYYIGDLMLAERTVASGEIGGATTGSFRIGANWHGWIDDLKVVSREISHEEIRQTWARLTRHQPGGVTTIRGLAPPGVVWSKSDGSDIGRLIKAAGQTIGFAAAKAHELRETFLPHAAYKDGIGAWEQLLGLQSRERLGLDLRRQAVVARLQVENGYSVPKVKAVLAAPFDVDEADVNIIEFSPTIEDDFTTLEIERWKAEPAAAWSIVAGEVQLSRPAGTDMRHRDGAYNPHRLRMPIDNGDSPVGLIARVKLSTYWANLPANAIVGLYACSFLTRSALWFGVKNVGGVRQLGHVSSVGGVLGAFTAIANPSTDAAYYLSLRKTELGYILAYSTIGFEFGIEVPMLGSVTTPEYVGAGGMCTDAATAGQLTATFDDFLTRMPNGKRAFRWFAYRDPGDPGDPDMEDAERIVQRIKPAHTEAHAITSTSCLAGNANSRCGNTPLGAI